MALTSKAKELMPYLDNPNVLAFLDTIADAEGARHGYRTGFGGYVIQDLSKHPNKLKAFTKTTGEKAKTSAAGRYQFVKSTWDALQDRLGLPDFSSTSQDLAALELIREQGALEEVANGKFDEAFQEIGDIWASLPSSNYDQPTRSEAFIDKAITANLAERMDPNSEVASNIAGLQNPEPSPSATAGTGGLDTPAEAPTRLPEISVSPSEAQLKGLLADNLKQRLGTTTVATATGQLAPGAQATTLPEITVAPQGLEALKALVSESRSEASVDEPQGVTTPEPGPAYASGDASAATPVELNAASTLAMAAQAPRIEPPSGQGSPDLASRWENRLLAQVAKTDAGATRKRAQGEFFGDDVAPDIALPKALQSAINRVTALL